MDICSQSLKNLSQYEYEFQGKKEVLPELLFGDLKTNLLKVLFEKFRDMKVIVCYSEKTHGLLSDTINSVFELSSSRHTDIIAKSSKDLFNFGEEYRLIISVGESCVNACKIFSAGRNIPMLVISTDGNLAFCFSNYALVKADGLYKQIKAESQKIFIFDQTLINNYDKNCIANTASHALCYILGLFDFAIFSGSFYNGMDTEVTSLMRYVVKGFLSLDYSLPNFHVTYLDLAIKTAIAELLSGEYHILLSTPSWCAMYSGKKDLGIEAYLHLQKLYDLYKIYLNENASEFNLVADYNGNIEYISSVLKIKEKYLYEINKFDAKEIYNTEKEFDKVRKHYGETLETLKNTIDKGLNTIGKLLGKELEFYSDDISELHIKTAPYVTERSLFIKLVRDAGFLDY